MDQIAARPRAEQYPTPAMSAELAAALVAACKAAEAVEKNKKHDFHKYRYVSADAMIAEGREALGGAGLTLFTAGWRFEPLEVAAGPAADGKAPSATVIGRVSIGYRLVHTSGAFFDFGSSSFVVLEKGRPADKAEMGAITENLSYTIRGLLLLPRVDEAVAVERRDDRSFEPTQRPAPAANDANVDPAHAALAAEFKRRIGDLGDVSLYRDFHTEVAAANLPQPLLDDVRAELVVQGVRFAVEQEDLDGWVPKLQEWKLTGAARDRAAIAWEKRSDELAAQRGGAAA
jgi:hypothetical protein